MKVVHIMRGISLEGGGPSRSSQALVASLNAAGCDTWLLSCTAGNVPWIEGVTHFAAPEKGERLTDFFTQQFNEIKPDLIHLNHMWDWQIHLAVKTARQMGIPYVVAPRGSLEPWCLRKKWLKKRIARFLYQDYDLKKAVALHATAVSEAEQFKKLGFTNPIIISPNGVSLPKEGVMPKVEQMNGRGDRESVEKITDCHGLEAGDTPHRLLFVSRMHPKKGLLELVDVWARVSPKDWVCELVYTVGGNFELAYEAQVKAKTQKLGVENQFVFTGPLNDEAKWGAYARADAFILPTYSENFGLVVVEALWAGLPVITTRGTPWAELEERKCGWWVENDLETLARTIQAMMALSDEERRAMGARGRKLVEEKYQWPAIGRQMAREYERVVGN